MFKQIVDPERDKKVLIYVIGKIDKMRREGLLKGGPILTDIGRQEYWQLVTEGFRPTAQEIADAVAVIKDEASPIYIKVH